MCEVSQMEHKRGEKEWGFMKKNTNYPLHNWINYNDCLWHWCGKSVSSRK